MISIIIPTLNEEEHIKVTIQYLWRCDESHLITEIIIADGGSTDNTIALAQKEAAKIIMAGGKSRALQMNQGAMQAKGEILYFLHADTIPPGSFAKDIVDAVKSGFGAGCFTLSFDYKHWFLKANSWFTRFDVDALRFGDQSLFVTGHEFEMVGKFCEEHLVLEDQDIVRRLKKNCRFKVIRKPALTSARKYLENGIYKTQAKFFVIYIMYRLGFKQSTLLSTYKKLMPSK